MRFPDGVRGALWRSLTVYRWVSLAYAGALVGRTLGRADRPALGVTLFGVMVAWSLVMTLVAPARTGRRLGALVTADVAICAAMVLLTLPVGPPGGRALPAVWSASGVFSAALAGGTLPGFAAGAVLSVATFVERGGVERTSLGTAALFLLAGTLLGYLGRTALAAEAALGAAVAARAGDLERERLARGVHDSVLQVLALIAREAPRLPATEVAALAGQQEAVLRELVQRPPGGAPTGEADLAELLAAFRPAVTVSTPGAPVPLPAAAAAEVTAAVRAALENVDRHAGPGAAAWVLLEDDGDTIAVTVRDDGVGIAPGRAAAAAAEGRLGLASSICGRIAELGGSVQVTGYPSKGTEVELRVPR